MVVNQSISLCHVGKTDLQTVLVELTSWAKYMQFLKIGAHWYFMFVYWHAFKFEQRYLNKTNSRQNWYNIALGL